MTKKQVVWLIIKLIGVYFAYSAIVAVPGAISSIYTYASLPSPPRFSKAENPAANVISPNLPVNPTLTNPAAPKIETETPVEKAKNEALKLLLWNVLATVFYGLVGWYLIRDGRFLFALLGREEPFGASNETTDDASFPVSRKKEEVVTSLNLSGGKEEITSLNLSDSANTPVETPVSPPAPPENTLYDAPVQETVTSLNLSDSIVEEPKQTQIPPVETTENALLEIPEDESIDEQKY
ncbi:MAG: hypothetical protein WA584_22145 [Pyrinomonadaceae bacterium]